MLEQGQALIFLHLPKAAGTTLTRVIDRYFAPGEIYPHQLIRQLPADDAALRASLRDARLVRGHFHPEIGDYLPREAVYVTMLRDPVQRVISGYHYLRRAAQDIPREQWFPNIARAVEMPLAQWLVSGPGNDPGQSVLEFSRNGMCRFLAGADCPERDLLDRALATLDRCAVVGVSERFAESVDLLCYRMGWDWPGDMTAHNVRPRVTNEGREVLAFIRQQNALDDALYEHARERLARDLAWLDSVRPVTIDERGEVHHARPEQVAGEQPACNQ